MGGSAPTRVHAAAQSEAPMRRLHAEAAQLRRWTPVSAGTRAGAAPPACKVAVGVSGAYARGGHAARGTSSDGDVRDGWTAAAVNLASSLAHGYCSARTTRRAAFACRWLWL